ncbi:CUB domain-containing protein [Trichonephila inaurata madagascariensis]|uniref:CUB domain-containing protein n=1 Tax=Trichonephila inaurata madagascariensis TaxID=2747483 RepID=A0A8X6XKT3_9ARAC|nr:CUB domain-containing protein [Trichonephila inaurata madagascariensis]
MLHQMRKQSSEKTTSVASLKGRKSVNVGGMVHAQNDEERAAVKWCVRGYSRTNHDDRQTWLPNEVRADIHLGPSSHDFTRKCIFQFHSQQSPMGNFSSPLFPSNYTESLECVYNFQETIPPPRSTGNVSNCGGTVSGVGGVIVSPGFPYYFPKDVDCIWLIRVDYHMKIYVRILKMQLYGSIANCAEAELTLYDGYSSISFNPKVLQKYCGDLRYYKNVEEQTQLSSRNRLLLRFKTSAAQIMKGEDLDKNAVGFKIVWTAVDFKQEGKCEEFICKESRYCFSSPDNSCAEMRNYCIDKSLVCNGHPNCGNEDYTDEDKCNIPLLAGCGAAGGVLLLSFLIGFCLYRRHSGLRNSNSHSLNMQLRQLEHSPSYSGRPPSGQFYYPESRKEQCVEKRREKLFLDAQMEIPTLE